MKKAGMVAIVGRVNVGKSTLLNQLVGEKVAIVSAVPQTTRNQIRAIFNDERGQIVFLDTPGMHVAHSTLGRSMVAAINASLSGVDLVIHLVDVTERLGEEEEMMMNKIAESKIPIILGINKIDLGKEYFNDYVQGWQKKIGCPLNEAVDRFIIVPLSALDGTNTELLLEELFNRLPVGEPFYPEDILTDFPKQLTIQDLIREKLLYRLKDELPFAVAVFVEEMAHRNAKLFYVRAIIFVERKSQKAIVIGRGGHILKEVGQLVRHELEEIYGKKVFLDLWVKVDAKWSHNHELLRQMGYVC